MVALLALMVTAALSWAMRNQLDSHLGASGLDALIGASKRILSVIVENVPIMMLVLMIGLLAGAIISSSARRIDARLKSKRQWSLSSLKKEVGFSRWLCEWHWLGHVFQDMWEDLDQLSDQLVLRGLSALPPFEQGDKRSMRTLHGYLDVIHPHLTEKQLKYAILCGNEYLRNAESQKATVVLTHLTTPLLPQSTEADPEPTAGRPDPTAGNAVPTKKAASPRARAPKQGTSE
ncbi:hypothetical protein [Sphingomonas sp. R86521]|uniref:hypothetical protein n=1 Tax=Sphingomonas sp. R86521 TaxID=3093860 RepID=UPI0036D273F3